MLGTPHIADIGGKVCVDDYALLFLGSPVTPEDLKRRAAELAVALVEPNMVLGLGTGSTAWHFVDLLGGRVAAGLDVICIATSERTRAQAAALGIKLTSLDDHPRIDLTVDGADEVDANLHLIKGGGGALLREKIVATASARMIVIVDKSKEVGVLGAFPLPVEIVPFGMAATRRQLERAFASCGCTGDIKLRQTSDGHAFVTDGAHHIVDCALGTIRDPERLSAYLDPVTGVVDHGLFIGLATACIIADASGDKIIGDIQ